MITTQQLLSAAKGAQGIPSNYRLARVLDVPDRTVQRWAAGDTCPDDRHAQRLAELAGLDPGEVVASIRAERTNEPELRALWQSVADRLHAAGATALAVILSLWIGGGPDGAAMASTPVASSGTHLSITQFTVYTLARFGRFISRMFARQTCEPAAA